MHYRRLSCTTTEMTLNTNQNCVLYMCNLNSLNCTRSHVHTCLVPITISTPFPSSQPHNNWSPPFCIAESTPIKPCWLQVSGSNRHALAQSIAAILISYQTTPRNHHLKLHILYPTHAILFALAGFALALVLFSALPKDWMAIKICGGSLCSPLMSSPWFPKNNIVVTTNVSWFV